MNLRILDLAKTNYRSFAKIDTEIDDELDFHIQCRIDDLLAEGMPKEQAETKARSSFGSQDSIRRQCQRINYGYRFWVTGLYVVSLSIAAVAIAWLSIELAMTRSQNSKLATQLNVSTSSWASRSDMGTLQGKINDSDGNPISNVNVLIVLKTWPNGFYSQQNFAIRSQENGRFRYPELLPCTQKHAIHITAVASGYAFESQYIENSGINQNRRQPLIEFKLKRAHPVTVAIVDRSNNPIPGARIYASSRSTHEYEEMVYADSAEAIAQVTGENGIVEMNGYLANDFAQITYQIPGEGWQHFDTQINENEQSIIIITSEKNSY